MPEILATLVTVTVDVMLVPAATWLVAKSAYVLRRPAVDYRLD